MKKLVSLLFHRVVLVAFFLLIQVAVLVVMLLRFNNYFLPFYGVCVAISLFAVFWIVGRQSDPAYKIAWIIPILALRGGAALPSLCPRLGQCLLSLFF